MDLSGPVEKYDNSVDYSNPENNLKNWEVTSRTSSELTSLAINYLVYAIEEQNTGL